MSGVGFVMGWVNANSGLRDRLEKAYGKQITTRTWKTVHRIRKVLDT